MGASTGIDWAEVNVAVAPLGLVPGVRMAGFRHRGDASINIAMVPHPAVTVLIDLTDHGIVYDVHSGTRNGSVTAGLSSGPMRLAAPGPGEVLQVRLSPIAAVALFKDPEIIGGGVAQLSDLWGRRTEFVVEQVRALPAWDQRFAFIARTLLAQASGDAHAAPEVAYAWRHTANRRGRVRIDTLAEETGWSRQRLWSRFRSQLGLSPKRAAELMRFDHAARMLSAGRAPADVAHQAGYADQSHLHRQVKAIAHTTPSGVASAPWLGIDDIAWPTSEL